MDMAKQNSPRNRSRGRRNSGRGLLRVSSHTKKNLKKALLIIIGIVMLIGVGASIWLFSWLQALDEDLPSVETPFGTKEAASIIYDRNGVELYRLFNNFNRDPVVIEEIPHAVRWTFLAAEDALAFMSTMDLMPLLLPGVHSLTSVVETQYVVEVPSLSRQSS